MTKHYVFIFTSLVLVAASCRDREAHYPPPPHPVGSIVEPSVLKTYSFPEERRQQVHQVLSNLAWPITIKDSSGPRTMYFPAKPQYLGAGKVAFSAPESIHQGVPEMLRQLEQTSPASPDLVNLSVWLVTARPEEQAELPDTLQPIKRSLETISRDRTVSFSLLERLQISGLSGQKMKIEGHKARLQVVPTKRNDSIHLSLELVNGNARRSETAVTVKPSQQLVIGQVGYEAGPKEEVELYYIVVAK